MEVLQGQMSAFDFVEDVKREVIPKEKKIISKKKSIKTLEEVKNIEGQASIFDLVQEPKEEIKIEFTIEQLETIENLKKEKEWIEYSLYKSGTVIFITKENNIKVIPQGDITESFYIKDRYRSYFLKVNGEVDVIGIGITRWKKPIKTIIREEE
ncbi:hypothetical protein ACQPUH_01685 [Clostridium perfringens]|uniref:hypothetical protein n=1 Tax=Clostridium perfringens TaxID=1502 RepID=UPI0018E4797B|nr:hypothetical protein [Clostridium perfringens]MBI6017019.1 hypothetical protein [Clostridium perfringens]MDK0588574.1 hypothetical protein [Clostridium perfringens]MDM0527343.1 hypothetical protein [Clostridium perfringens]MDM0529204.1 hypothetical protein [Clostridium perfringens]MDM0539329.1 hypothetical protein [Clostridium perfringens]